ncbi:MAG: hypothetical protein ACF8Q5_05125 [Phycisphaerales bacterium JB040]
MVYAFAILILLGLTLLTLGLWPRRLGTAPHCRRCHFDLTGTEAARGSGVCPECGRDLTPPKAIARGRLARRKRVLLAGVLLLLLLGGLAIPIATGHWTNWNTSKPLWMLELDTDYGSVPIRDAARLELERRDMAGLLDARGERALLHAKAAQYWKPGALDLADFPLVQDAHEAGELSGDRWRRALEGIDGVVQTYLDAVTAPEVWGYVRAEDGRLVGEPLRPEFNRMGGPAGGIGVLVLYRIEAIEIGGEPVDPESVEATTRAFEQHAFPYNYIIKYDNGSRSSRVRDVPGHEEGPFVATEPAVWNLPAGEHELTVRWRFDALVDADLGRGRPDVDAAVATGEWLTGRDVTTTTRVRIDASDPSLIEPVSDPDRLGRARSYFSVMSANEGGWSVPPDDEQGRVPLTLSYGWGGPDPIEELALVGHFEIEWGGQRVRPEHQEFGRPSDGPQLWIDAIRDGGIRGGFGRTLLVTPPEPRPNTLTLVFVPELDAAPDYAGAWLALRGTPMPAANAEIRWENIPIQWLETEEAPEPAGTSDEGGN